MSYSTNDDLLKVFSANELGKLTGEPNGAFIEYSRIDMARDSADTFIDAHLRGKYLLPLNLPIDKLINKLSIDLTMFYLYEASRKVSIIPETIQALRKNAIDLLMKLAKGQLILEGYEAGFSAPPYILSNLNGDRIFYKNELDCI